MLIVMMVDDNNKRIIYLFVDLTYICLNIITWAGFTTLIRVPMRSNLC